VLMCGALIWTSLSTKRAIAAMLSNNTRCQFQVDHASPYTIGITVRPQDFRNKGSRPSLAFRAHITSPQNTNPKTTIFCTTNSRHGSLNFERRHGLRPFIPIPNTTRLHTTIADFSYRRTRVARPQVPPHRPGTLLAGDLFPAKSLSYTDIDRRLPRLDRQSNLHPRHWLDYLGPKKYLGLNDIRMHLHVGTTHDRVVRRPIELGFDFSNATYVSSNYPLRNHTDVHDHERERSR
jgi:hypothetical protein